MVARLTSRVTNEIEGTIILWILLEVSKLSQFVSRSYPNSMKSFS